MVTRRRSPTRLAVSDFDWTLFRSPEVPLLWQDRSLSPPFVPASPGSEWWIGPTVAAVRSAIAHPATRTVLMTGRSPDFAGRVEELLAGVGLHFDEYHFATCDPLTFKLAVLEDLLRAHPTVERVAMWDDLPEHADAFERRLTDLGVVGDVRLIVDD